MMYICTRANMYMYIFLHARKHLSQSKPATSFKDIKCRNTHSEILLNQTEIKLYLPFSDCFGAKHTSVWFKINRKMAHTQSDFGLI